MSETRVPSRSGSSHASVPNRRFICEGCGLDLGTHIDHLYGRGRTVNVNLAGETLCDRCFGDGK